MNKQKKLSKRVEALRQNVIEGKYADKDMDEFKNTYSKYSMAKVTTIPKSQWGVHIRHCEKDSCKYGDKDCPVAIGLAKPDPFYSSTTNPRKPMTKEDFQRKPDYDVGDFCISDPDPNIWKRATKGRLEWVKMSMVEIVKLYPVHFGGEIICWKCNIRHFSKKIFTGIPAEGYVKVPQNYMRHFRGLVLTKKLGL